jgi:hypothetical protein
VLQKSIAVEVDAFCIEPLARRSGEAHFSSLRPRSGLQEYPLL